MKRKLFIAIGCFVLGLGIYQLLPRTTYIDVNESTAYMSLEEMVCKADLILEGTVQQSMESQWDISETGETLDTMHTDVQITPENTLLSEEKDSSVLVRTHIGEIDRTIQTSSSYPTLSEGEQVLLFLDAPNDPSEPYAILGSSQGKFTLTEQDGESVYSNGRDVIPVSDWNDTLQQIAAEYADTEWPSDYYTPEEIKEMNDALFHVNQ